MKTQIRQSVFETNSSSTHSISISKLTINEAMQEVNEHIQKAYSNFENDDYYFDEKNYIDGETLILKGFNFEKGEEERNIYYIINNWMAKIQYMAMLIDNYAYYIDGYDQNSCSYNDSAAFTEQLLLKTEAYNTFIDMVKNYASAKGYIITNVKYDMQEYSWIENIFVDEEDFNGFKNNTITKESISHLFSMMMMEDHVITYIDEAYHPYKKPEIYIL